MSDLCIYCLLFAHAPLFLRDADILITCDWVMVISGLYISVTVSVLSVLFLGYDVPACGSRVPLFMFVYISLLFLVILLLLLLDISGWSFGWCDLY